MLLTRYPDRAALPVAPWRALGALSNRMSHLIDEALDGVEEPEGVFWAPAFDIVENSDALILTADLPGMTVDQVDIEFENNVLTVSGNRERPELANGDRRMHSERPWGRFQRTFSLPRTVDPDGITAQFDNGVLTVHLPKVAAAKGRKIEIRSRA